MALQLVTVGGEILGQQRLPGEAMVAALRCARCGKPYLMGAAPVALALGPLGATVVSGFVERCPHCHHEHVAGAVLTVELI